MAELWFAITAATLTAYVVLDGFDFGAGALHLWVARSDAERRQVLAAIGPYWDGNEVWLLATGGALFVAFPAVLAAGLSGFYFAIFLLLWTLILRGIAIEFRSHVEAPLWRSAWDAVFGASSTLLPVLFGAALGNLLRGLPLDSAGWFSLSLFTDFGTTGPVGILDWYTVSSGIFALVVLAGHGATFLAWKTDGPVHARCRSVIAWCYGAAGVLWPVLTIATILVNPRALAAVPDRPLAWIALVVASGGFASVWLGLRQRRPAVSFLGSCAFLAGLLGATAAALFPVLLRAVDNEAWSLTVYNAAAPDASLRIALGWWSVGIPLAIVYFVVVFRLHAGKAIAATGRDGY